MDDADQAPESNDPDRGAFGAPSVAVPERGDRRSGAAPSPAEASEAFEALASEVRVATLVELLAAERADEDPLTFSELQAGAGVEESAGFAYHLRQLTGTFLRKTGEGYVLTPAGRRAARAVVSGAFTGGDRTSAS